MLDQRIETLLTVAELKNFTKAAARLSLTQPAVSHHIALLEEDLGVTLFLRSKSELKMTPEGELVVNYAKRFKAMDAKLRSELADGRNHLTKLRIGITHTAESNIITELLARFSKENGGTSITVITDTIKNLYDKLENFELDLAIVEGRGGRRELNTLMLDTDYLVCAMSNLNPLSQNSMVTLQALKKEQMILRLPTSATRMLFESTLESMNDSISNFNVILEVDNIATIKDLVRKNFGVSILAKSTCLRDSQQGKLTILPIENLSMVRETNIVYNRNFAHEDILQALAKLYQETIKKYYENRA